MHTENSIWIQASPQAVFNLAADIQDWPAILPHYRWVRLMEMQPDSKMAEMSAKRGPFPVRWTSTQQLFLESGRIAYYHLRGLTEGMKVEWIIEARDEGTHVVILHDLRPKNRLLRIWPASWIMAEFFIRGIAARTLQRIKLVAEARQIGVEK